MDKESTQKLTASEPISLPLTATQPLSQSIPNNQPLGLSPAEAQDWKGQFEGIEAIPAWKRALDFTLILLASPILLVVCSILALWVKIVSRGPILFKQERAGFRAVPFTIYKFRTMDFGTETKRHEDHFEKLVSSDSPMAKLDKSGDSRLIFGGSIMRAAGLDELPQLLNVLKGDMSLAGPRPCLMSEVQYYHGKDRRRFNTAPGMTGYWQVNGKNKTTFSEMVEMDIEYVSRRSLRMDLWIFAMTIPALVMQLIDQLRAVLARKLRSNGADSGSTSSSEG